MAVEPETTTIAPGIKLNEHKCVKCLTCYRVCPFDAIVLTPKKVNIDIEKCQICGLCASLCPAQVIDPEYYDNDTLIKYVQDKKLELDSETLVIMCRGSTPPSCDIIELLKKECVDKFIPLRLPCVGRVHTEFYLESLLAGIKKIILIQCDDISCRMKKGSENSSVKVEMIREILNEMDHDDNVLTVIENPLKAEYLTDKCVGCDKCVFICPYDAIKAKPLATPEIDLETCRGCGACALICPHLAIQLRGFEYNPSVEAMHKIKNELESKAGKETPKILVYCCQWSEYSELDNVQNGILQDNVAIVEIPCANGLDPVQVMDAFRSGFDGVLVVVCADEDCKLKEGRATAEVNFAAIEKTLKNLGMVDRFKIVNHSPRYLGEFDSKLGSFISKISNLPDKGSGGEN
jgi:coenzyme F420-reducing hydrogenase delta subunit/ferredoxin